MINGLLLHLQEDTYVKNLIIWTYKNTKIPNVYVNDNGIEAARDLIVEKKPQVIVIQDEPDFMNLAEEVGELSPQSLNIINKSMHDGTGIRIRKDNKDYERLRELEFVIYRYGCDLNNLCGMLKKYHSGKFKLTLRQRISRVDPFEAMKGTFRERFDHNYPVI